MKELQNFLFQTLSEVVQLQELFDKAFEHEFLRLEAYAKKLPEMDPAVLAGLIPNRMAVGQFELKCNLCIERAEQRQLGFTVKNIPLQLKILAGEKLAQHVELTISVKQAHLSKNPFSKP
ncbi:MAG: hypothetical protein J5I98_33910 [Phaeodactylibacter sp.]|nr:hypothetical protein [Phaeodactylibacter sp.]